MEQTNQSQQEIFTYDEFIQQLKFKVINELNNQKIASQKADNSLQRNKTIYNRLKYLPDAVRIFEILTILGIAGFGIFLGYQSYLIPNTISSLTFLDKFSTVILFLLSGSCLVTTGITYYKFSDINYVISGVLDKLIVQPLAKHLVKKNKILENTLKNNDQKITTLQAILKSIDESRDDFKYLIHSSLKDKTFTENEINLIYQYLTSSNINALIYFLYHDELSTLEAMPSLKVEELAEKLQLRITKVKEYSKQLKTSTPSQENVRMRRFERFHTYPYDDIIAEQDRELAAQKQPTHR